MSPVGIAVQDLPGNPLAADIQLIRNSKNKTKRLGAGQSEQRRAIGDWSALEACRDTGGNISAARLLFPCLPHHLNRSLVCNIICSGRILTANLHS